MIPTFKKGVIALWLKRTALILGVVLLIAFGLRYLLPFIIAFIIATMLEPLIRFFMRTFKIRRRAASWLTLLLGVGGIGSILVTVIIQLIQQMIELSYRLPAIYQSIYSLVEEYASKGTAIYQGLPVEVTNYINDTTISWSKKIPSFLNGLITGVVNTAGTIPQKLFFFVVTILALYFFMVDREKFFVGIQKAIPSSWLARLMNLKDDLFSALFAYIKAQGIMMSITFTELFVGFTLLKVNYALALAVIISLLDALPIVGTGGILVPWAIFELLAGDRRLGILIIVLYLIVVFVRQMIEPKIVSSQIGIHPLVTLTGMYVGLQIFGIIGFILGPIIMLILRNILLQSKWFREKKAST